MNITPDSVWSHIEIHRRVTGAMPKLREVVEHFDGKLLNVLLCLGELDTDRKESIREWVRDANTKRRGVKA